MLYTRSGRSSRRCQHFQALCSFWKYALCTSLLLCLRFACHSGQTRKALLHHGTVASLPWTLQVGSTIEPELWCCFYCLLQSSLSWPHMEVSQGLARASRHNLQLHQKCLSTLSAILLYMTSHTTSISQRGNLVSWKFWIWSRELGAGYRKDRSGLRGLHWESKEINHTIDAIYATVSSV